MQAIILAGGKGTRLRPLTYTIAKPLIKLVNKPVLQYQIELLKKYGIDKIILCLNYKPDEIEEYFQDGKKFGVNIQYVLEDKPLGTGGAIKNAEVAIEDENVIIFNGDILCDFNIQEIIDFHKSKKSDMTITLIPVEDPTFYGLVVTNDKGEVIQFLEKPNWDQIVTNTINAGIYIMEKDLLKYIPREREYSLEREFFPYILEMQKKFHGITLSSYWIDIGTPKKYQRASFDILEGKIKVDITGKKAYGGIYVEEDTDIHPSSSLVGFVYLGRRVKIDKNVVITGPVILENDCIVNQDSRISNAIICERTEIGEKAQIQNSIIGRGCKIEKEAYIAGGSVIGDNCIIKNGLGKIS